MIMTSRQVFSPERAPLKTYGRANHFTQRPRGVLAKKQDIDIGLNSSSENANPYSLSDDSDDSPKLKATRRKSATVKRKAAKSKDSIMKSSVEKQAKTMQTQLNETTRNSLKKNVHPDHIQQNVVQGQKTTPKRDMVTTKRKAWVKVTVGTDGSEDSEDSIELPRKDQDMTWQEKIDLLMPKMYTKQQPDDKPTGMMSRLQKSAFARWLNVSAESVVEGKESSDGQMMSGHHTKSARVTGPPSPSIKSPVNSTLEDKETFADSRNCLPSSVMEKSSTAISSNDDYTYTYQWVTQSKSDIHSTKPDRLSQKSKSCSISQNREIQRSSCYFNSTKKHDALSIIQAKFPVEISAITNSPSQGADYPTTSEVRKSYPLQQTTVSPVATWSSLVRSDGPIDYFSSTVKKGGLDIDQVHFGLDLSNIEGTIDVQRKPCQQNLQENTPVSAETRPVGVTPTKHTSGKRKKKRKLLPRTSTMLFASDCLDLCTPGLSTIRTSAEKTVFNSYLKSLTSYQHDGKDSRTSDEKNAELSILPNSCSNSKMIDHDKILTSTPVPETEKQFRMPEINLTCVPRPQFDNELDLHSSIDVNSDEIVADSPEEDTIHKEEYHDRERLSQQFHMKTPEQISCENRTILSVAQLPKHLSVKPVTKSLKNTVRRPGTTLTGSVDRTAVSVRKSGTTPSHKLLTECPLMDHMMSTIQKQRFILYSGQAVDERRIPRSKLPEDVLLTHIFQRRY